MNRSWMHHKTDFDFDKSRFSFFYRFLFLTDMRSVNYFGEFQTRWLNRVNVRHGLRRKLLKTTNSNRALFDRTLVVVNRFQ